MQKYILLENQSDYSITRIRNLKYNNQNYSTEKNLIIAGCCWSILWYYWLLLDVVEGVHWDIDYCWMLEEYIVILLAIAGCCWRSTLWYWLLLDVIGWVHCDIGYCWYVVGGVHCDIIGYCWMLLKEYIVILAIAGCCWDQYIFLYYWILLDAVEGVHYGSAHCWMNIMLGSIAGLTAHGLANFSHNIWNKQLF